MHLPTRSLSTGAVFAIALILCSPLEGRADEPVASKSLHLGIVRTLFRDATPPLVKALTEPLGLLIRYETGLPTTLTTDDSALHLGRDLADGQVQIGVFQGIEFAWAKARYPQLKALVIVTDGQPFRRAYLVVNARSTIHGFGDLHKPVSMPLFSHEQCYLFVRKQCRKAGMNADKAIARMARPENAGDALDDVADGRCPGVIVEEMALECYRKRKPGRFTNLRIVAKSPKFPASVVAYCPNHISSATLQRFRDILLHASQMPLGRQVLTLWRVTDFEPVPAGYDQSLKDIVKQYPAPTAGTRTVRETNAR